jgi:hypothetical protein
LGALTDIRHVQLARILGLPRDSSPLAIENAARAMPGRFAAGLFGEAVDSDDVTGPAAAIAYLEDRLSVFQDLLPGDTLAAVREAFAAHIRAWDD